MYLLVVRDPDGNETEYDLVGEVVLGRDATASIQIADASVSRRHARLFFEGERCFIEDLGSSNGTLLQGQAITAPAAFPLGVEVELGDYVIFLDSDQEEPSTDAGAPAPVLPDDDEKTFAGPSPLAAATPAAPAPAAEPAVGTLVVTGGPKAGQRFELRGQLSVGRVDANDVALGHASVSRSHAELTHSGDQVILRDLGSSNGSYVNESRVTETPILGGDLLRFGDITATFEVAAGVRLRGADILAPPPEVAIPAGPTRPGSRGAQGAGGDGKKKALIAGLAGLVALIGVAAILTPGAPPEASGPVVVDSGGEGEEIDNLREKVYQLVRKAKSAMDSLEWEKARGYLDEAVTLDPIDRQARTLKEQVDLEIKMQVVYEDAANRAELGGEDEALDLFITIDQDSRYYGEAVNYVDKLIDVVMKRNGPPCLGAIAGRNHKSAWALCGRFLDLACQCPGLDPDDIQGKLRKLELNAGRPAAERWTCPARYQKWSRCVRDKVDEGIDPRVAIAEKYPNEKIAGAMRAYLAGDAKKAAQVLTEEREKSADEAEKKRLGELQYLVLGAERRFQQGQGALLRGDLKSAESEWDQVLRDDTALMPEGARSLYREEITKQLSEAHAGDGVKLFELGRYVEAFGAFSKATAMNPTNRQAVEGFQRLERVAQKAVDEAQTCGDLKEVLGYTRSEPASPAHKSAKASFEGSGCS